MTSKNTHTDNTENINAANTPKSISNKKPIIIIIVAAILLIIAGVSTAAAINYNSPAQIVSRTIAAADRYLSEQNYEQAIIEYKKVIEIEPMNVDAYIGLADAYIGTGDNEKAIEALQTGYEKTSDEQIKTKLDELVKTQALEQGDAFFSNKEYEKAIEEYSKVLEIDKLYLDAYLKIADSYIQLGDTDKAIEEYRKVLEIDELYVDAYLKIADLYIQLGDTDKAIEILQIGFDKTGDTAINDKLRELKLSKSITLGKKYLSESKFDLAEAEFENVLKISDTNVEAYIGKADAFIGQQRTDDAISQLEVGYKKTNDEEIKTKLNILKAAENLKKAREYFSKKEYENAINEYQAVLNIEEQCAEAYIGIADSYLGLDKLEEAVKILETGLEKTKDTQIEKKLTELRKRLALNNANKYLSEKDYAKAIEEFNKVLEIDSKCVEAYQGLADCYIGLGDIDKAVETLQTGYNNTQSEEILSRLNELKKSTALQRARSYLAKKDYNNAAAEYQNVLNLDSSCVEAYLGKADAYMGLNDRNSANSILQTGFARTWNGKIQEKIFEIRLNYITLTPKKGNYEPLSSLTDQILSQITTPDMNTYQKVKACYDYLIVNCSYGSSSIVQYLDLDDILGSGIYFQEKSAYAMLKDHVGVCDDYSAAFAALANSIGLNVTLRSGQTARAKPNSGFTGHVWCELVIDGTTYVFDPQVEDNMSQGGAIGYARFCKTYEEVPNRYIIGNGYEVFYN